jgi:acetyl esterase/lipase
MHNKSIIPALCMLAIVQFSSAQKVIQLYNGAPPGSESWNWQEKELFSPMITTEVVYNVARPSLTLFRPDSVPANGTAVIICPGGGFRFLSINSEGNDVAKWLVKKGVTCFVLKYRLVHVQSDDPVKEMFAGLNEHKKFDEENRKLIPLAITDARTVIAYVRAHAAEFGISSNRIGIVGFSAGGTVTESSAFNYDSSNRPDFVAPIYAYVPADQNIDAPKDAPPMFLAVASDDQLHLVPNSLSLYNKWEDANKSVELHIYAKGGHGFGMRVQHLSSDTWIDRFGDWMNQLGLLKSK